MRFSASSVALLIILSLLPEPTTANEALRAADEQRRQLERIEQTQRLRQLQRSQPAPTPPPRPAPPLPQAQRCLAINGLRISGNQRLGQAPLAAAARPYLQACMGVAQINQLLAALTQRYLDAGYIAARAYLAQAPSAGASLDIRIVEGFVEAIELADPDLRVSLQSAFPDLLGAPLQLRELERGLDQINRLRAFDVTADIEPGQLAGGSRIVVRSRQPEKLWRLSAVYDNGGRALSGRHQGKLAVSVDSPLALNDGLVVMLGRTRGNRPSGTQSLLVHHSLPYGAWTLASSLARSEQELHLLGGRAVAQATTEDVGLSLSRSLWRNQNSLWNASLRLNRKSVDSALSGPALAVQQVRSSVAEVGISVMQTLDNGLWSGYLGYARGLGAWQASARLSAPGAPQPRFEKYRASVEHLHGGRVLGQPLQWHNQLELQYSPDPLPATEQATLTSQGSVRGFRDTTLATSSAAVWRQTWRSPQALAPGLSLTPHLGFDLGWGQHTYESKTLQTRYAGSASAGASLGWLGGTLKLDYQQGLFTDAAARPEPGFWLVELTLQY
ncbi:ShlB/FhaC/HecB family hemolysin secretion/activation protein [Pseudomonas sp. nanlin1]|uniref:ShlB/FhaC/HecB family hemolysin secretion/activation protein n=1 Tax=Pseudomonas sp. nanlin1 TaxID=3040605 RepID=UPI00389004D4